ncbi:MAG TPA: porin family protein [Devosia sp.]|nr:porin family protein [Devosia sp.]
MKAIALAAAFCGLVSAPAMAADFLDEVSVLTPAPAYDWSGFYAGFSLGGGLTTTTVTEYESEIWDYGDFSATGFGLLAGLNVGANAQFGAGVVGIEADINWTNLGASTNWDDGDITNSVRWNWLSTIRARAGLAVDNALIYATGGVALVDAHYQYGEAGDPDNSVTFDGLQVGLAAGVGAEYALDENLSIKAEYLYVGLPSVRALDTDDNPYDFASGSHLLKVGLNYRF